ncbi:MAG: hypothetical protein NVSMB68_10400 [Thermoanaerobaculia bacterium]
MRRDLRKSAFLVLGVIFTAAAVRAQTISGTVRDAENGPPLASMVVEAYTPTGTLQARTTTDANGHYDLAVPAGSYRVLAYDQAGTYATGFAGDAPSFEESAPVTVKSGATVTLDFLLHHGVTISGRVTTNGGMRSFTVAAYNLSGTRRGFIATNDSGSYSIVLPPGSYKFVAYDDAGAFAPSFFRDQSSFTAADIVTVAAGRAAPAVDFFLQLGAHVSGSVTDSNGNPIANASVLAYSAEGKFVSFATTTADGRFTMTLTPGAYRLVAVDNAFKFAAAFLGGAASFENSQVLRLIAGQVTSNLTFLLEPGGLVAGRVVDAVSGAGIAGITVAAYNPDGSSRTFVTTDANGRYVLLLPPGNFRIAAFDPSLIYATQFYPQGTSFFAAVVISSTAGSSISLQPLSLVHGGRVSGIVTDGINHGAIGGAVILAYDTNGNLTGRTTSASNGTYRLVLPPGSYRVVASDPQLFYAPGYSGGATNFDEATTLKIAADTDTTADFALQRGTLVSGSVVNASHEPVAGLEVTILDLNGNRVASATTAADGTFKLAVAAAAYKILIADPAGRYASSYFGGSTFGSASIFNVDATGAPPLTVSVQSISRRRAVHH